MSYRWLDINDWLVNRIKESREFYPRKKSVEKSDILLKWKLKYFYQLWQAVWWPIQNYSLNYTIYDQVKFIQYMMYSVYSRNSRDSELFQQTLLTDTNDHSISRSIPIYSLTEYLQRTILNSIWTILTWTNEGL